MPSLFPGSPSASSPATDLQAIARPRQERPRGMYVLAADTLDVIYGPDTQRELAVLCDFAAPPQSAEDIRASLPILRDTEVIFSGWGAPILDEEFLAAAPNLKAIFYGAGSIRYITTEAFWKRGIVISSAYAANALPVAEYTVATILLSLKHFWRLTRETLRGSGWGDHTRVVPGTFRSSVGLVSFGATARKTLELLAPFDVRKLVFCPFLTREEAAGLGVELCSLTDIFRRADVVSLHTPDLPETRGLITGKHFSLMKEGATFINTARGRIVRETEMLEVLQQRPDLTAVLDVCDPEPPLAGSTLLTLPNVVLSPHIAGSLGPECQRLGHYMLLEYKRYLAGQPLQWQITHEMAAKMA